LTVLLCAGCWSSCFKFPIPTFDAGHLGPGPDLTGPAPDLSTFTNGGSADLNGDGVVDFVTTLDGGTKTVVYQLGPDAVVLTLYYPDPNTVQATGDFNQDGMPDYLFDGAFDGGTLTEVEQYDHDFDGVIDEELQRTVTFAGDGGATLTQSDLTLGDGGLTVASSFTGPAEAGNGKCEGMVPFPDVDGNVVAVKDFERIQVVANGKPNACPPELAKRLADIIREAILEDMDCLTVTNGVAYVKLISKLNSVSDYYIGCGNPCGTGDAEALASTDIFGTWHWLLGVNTVMGTNLPMSIANHSDDEIREVFAHELLHFAGYAHNPMPDGNGGHDLVYGCGRYCNACRSHITEGNGGAITDFSSDYAWCLDDERRALAGSHYTQPGPSLCVPATVCGDCTACQDIVVLYCNDQVATRSSCCSQGGNVCQQGFMCAPPPPNGCAQAPVGWCDELMP
jgi:hypothetical protein